jgi:NAD(P)H dehydrogenase (quinone)
MKVLVVFYSTYGHVHKMAEAVAQGAKEIAGTEVEIRRVPETLPQEVLAKMGAVEAQKQFSHIPVCTVAELPGADAIIFGTPTRFGNMCAQMRNFLDQTGPLWAKNALLGKVASVFTCTQSQHGGQETTITSFHSTLLHHGMIIVGLPYSAPGITTMKEVTGGTPYGASSITGAGDEMRMPTALELGMCRFQGEHVARIVRDLVAGREGGSP